MLDITKLNINWHILPQHGEWFLKIIAVTTILTRQTFFNLTAGSCYFSTVVCPIGCSSWVFISEPPTFTGYLLHRPQQVIALPHWTTLSELKGIQLCIWNRTPIPSCEVVQRPSAIFRCEGSKSITERKYWDSWISTSSGIGVIMRLYLSTLSSLCPYHYQIHFSVSQYCILP